MGHGRPWVLIRLHRGLAAAPMEALPLPEISGVVGRQPGAVHPVPMHHDVACLALPSEDVHGRERGRPAKVLP